MSGGLALGHYGNGPIRSSSDRLLRAALTHASAPSNPTANTATTAPTNMGPSTDSKITMASTIRHTPNTAVTMRAVLELCLSFLVRCASWCITFDMSGSRKPAKPAGGCPLDGGVRRHFAFPKRTAYVFQASSTNVPLDWRKVPSGLVMFVKIAFRAKSSTCTTVVLFASCHVTKKINSATG